MDPERYLARIGIDPPNIDRPDIDALERLQRAHVRTVPFETLSITGDPHGTRDGDGVSLDRLDLYEKIVVQRRGGFCYELNGLFGWLLKELGFDVRRVAARIKSDGRFGPPADHLTLLASLGDRYLIDVGLGVPKLRRPLPLDGTVLRDSAGIAWRTTGCDRPDADYTVQYRRPDDADWATRCIVRDVPREMRYFEATCEYFEYAPESAFTGDPVVTLATEQGHLKLSPERLTESVGADVDEQAVGQADWYRLLKETFGIEYRPSNQVEP